MASENQMLYEKCILVLKIWYIQNPRSQLSLNMYISYSGFQFHPHITQPMTLNWSYCPSTVFLHVMILFLFFYEYIYIIRRTSNVCFSSSTDVTRSLFLSGLNKALSLLAKPPLGNMHVIQLISYSIQFIYVIKALFYCHKIFV